MFTDLIRKLDYLNKVEVFMALKVMINCCFIILIDFRNKFEKKRKKTSNPLP